MKRNFHKSIGKTDRRAAVLVVVAACAMAAAVVLLSDGGESARMPGWTEKAPAGRPLAHGKKEYRPYSRPADRVERFVFDPNTADSTALLRLGLKPWQVRNIYKYRAKGGIYRKPSDFARLYGLTVGQYRSLEPYIRIDSSFLPAATLAEARQFERDTVQFPVKLEPGRQIALNRADTNMLKKVPGIGSAFAAAICRYGERLGGYVSVDQLDEISGLPKGVKRFFVVSDPAPQKLNINKLSARRLSRHPYIGFFRAKAIMDYRRTHGDISHISDLRLCPDFPEVALEKLAPYIEY